MEILHVYDEADSMAAMYVAMLSAEALKSGIAMRKATDAKSFTTLCQSQRPDIVHVHGRLTFQLPGHHRIVFSPHGQTIVNVWPYVIVARSKIESERMAESRICRETVLNPLITRTTTPAFCLDKLMQIYRKVMDSNVLQLLDNASRHILAAALCAAICGDRRWVADIPTPEETEKADYRRLSIYASQEGVLPMFIQGLELLEDPQTSNLKSQISNLKSQIPTGYLPSGFRIPEPMDGATATELVIDIHAHGPSLLRLAELSAALQRPTNNEQLLMDELEERHLRPFMASLLPLLEEQTMLTEGFMPCQPCDDDTTIMLRQKLKDRQNPIA